jgi:hypothetical protein
MYFARSGVVIDGYYAAYPFTADVSRWAAPRSGFVQRPIEGARMLLATLRNPAAGRQATKHLIPGELKR